MNRSTTSVELPIVNNNQRRGGSGNQTHTLPPPEDISGGVVSSYRSTEYTSKYPNSSNNTHEHGNYYYDNASRSELDGSSGRRRLIVPDNDDDDHNHNHNDDENNKNKNHTRHSRSGQKDKNDRHHDLKNRRHRRETIDDAESVLSHHDDDERRGSVSKGSSASKGSPTGSSPLSTPPRRSKSSTTSKKRQQTKNQQQQQQQQRSPQASPSSYNLRNNNNSSVILGPASGTVELALELEAIGGTNNSVLEDQLPNHFNFRTGDSSSSSASSSSLLSSDAPGGQASSHQASSAAFESSHRSDQQQQIGSGHIRTIAKRERSSSSLQSCSQNNSHGSLRNSNQTGSKTESPVTATMTKQNRKTSFSDKKQATGTHEQKKKEVRIASSKTEGDTTNDDDGIVFANTNRSKAAPIITQQQQRQTPAAPLSSLSSKHNFDVNGKKNNNNDHDDQNKKLLLNNSGNYATTHGSIISSAGGGDSSPSSHTNNNNSAEDDDGGSSDGYVKRLLSVVPGRSREEMLSSSSNQMFIIGGQHNHNHQNDDDDDEDQPSDFSSSDHQEPKHLPKKKKQEVTSTSANRLGIDSSTHQQQQTDDQKQKQEQAEPSLKRVGDELEEFAADSEKAKRFYREVLDQPFSAVVVMSSQNTQIIWVNNYACTMFNLVETDMVGKDISILIGNLPVPDKKAFHQAKVASFMSLWKQKKTMPESKVASGRVLELPCSRYDDSKQSTTNFTAELVVRPISMTQATPQSPPQAFVGFLRDISAEKTMVLQLDQQETTVDHTSGATIIADTFGTIKHINKAACKLFGYAAKFLIDTEANIKMLMPEKFAREHDKYLKTFREKLKMPGYDLRKSWVIEKELALPARRSDGSEIEMAIKIHYCRDRTGEGHDRLVAYVRDRKSLIKAQEVKSEIQRRVFPESIAKVLSQKSQTSKNNDIRHVQTYHNIPVIMIDIVDFVGISQRLLGTTTGNNNTNTNEKTTTATTTTTNHEAVYHYLTSFFDSITTIAADFQIEIVKTNADGVIGVCGIDEFDDRRSRVDRIVCFGLEVLRWCQGEDRQVRVGVGYGEVGSAVFEISKGRPTFDIWSSAINFASRCEKYADPQSIQITAQAFKHISTTAAGGESSIASLFKPRVYKNGIKGMQEEGTQLITYVTPKNLDHFSTAELTEHVKATCLSRLFLKKENARQLQEQQDRRTKNRGLAA